LEEEGQWEHHEIDGTMQPTIRIRNWKAAAKDMEEWRKKGRSAVEENVCG
jgi:hypothetical protein